MTSSYGIGGKPYMGPVGGGGWQVGPHVLDPLGANGNKPVPSFPEKSLAAVKKLLLSLDLVTVIRLSAILLELLQYKVHSRFKVHHHVLRIT